MKIFEVEQKDPYKIAAELIMQNCGPFLRQIKSLKTDILYRGVNGIDTSKLMVKLPCPVNRKPSDTWLSTHDAADQWFLDNTGIRYRSNSVFCTGDQYVASGYGDTFAIIPVGEFSFCYSNIIGDMTYAVGNLKEDPDTDEGVAEIHKILKKGKYQQNTNLRSAIKSGSEIMIHCDSYYAIIIPPSDNPYLRYNNIVKHINRGMLG